MKTILKILALSLIVFGSCYSPQPISKLKYDTDNITWIQGKAFTSLDLDSITVSLGLKTIQKNKLTLDLHVKNNSGKTILVDPKKCHLHIPNYIPTNRYRIDTMAVDPEKKILQINKDISQQESSAKNETSFLVFSYLAHTALTVAEVATDTPPEIADVNFIMRSEIIDETHRSIEDKEFYIEDLHGLNMYWNEQYFRKTHLNPNFIHYGLIEFSLPEAGYFEVVIEFENKKFIFGLNHTKEKAVN